MSAENSGQTKPDDTLEKLAEKVPFLDMLLNRVGTPTATALAAIVGWIATGTLSDLEDAKQRISDLEKKQAVLIERTKDTKADLTALKDYYVDDAPVDVGLPELNAEGPGFEIPEQREAPDDGPSTKR